MNVNTTSGLTTHFEIWFFHWSVIEYSQVLFHYIYINVNTYNCLAFENLPSNYVTNIIIDYKKEKEKWIEMSNRKWKLLV